MPNVTAQAPSPAPQAPSRSAPKAPLSSPPKPHSSVAPPVTPPQPQPGVRSRVNITLPANIQDVYDQSAVHSSLDQVFSDRLSRCVWHDAVKPLYFDDSLRRDLERTLGVNVSSEADMLDYIRQAMSVRVGEHRVPVSPDMLMRLKSRCQDPEFDRWLSELVLRLLTLYTEGQLG